MVSGRRLVVKRVRRKIRQDAPGIVNSPGRHHCHASGEPMTDAKRDARSRDNVERGARDQWLLRIRYANPDYCFSAGGRDRNELRFRDLRIGTACSQRFGKYDNSRFVLS
jgi:hypothetical protein